MAVGNTIGRIVGQSPGSSAPAKMANPVVQMFQGLQQLVSMWQQLSGIVQQLGGGGGASGGGASPSSAAGASPGGGSIAVPADLQASLTELGRSMRVGPEGMEGPPRPDQIQARELSDEIVRQVMMVSGARGQPVNALTLEAANQRVTELAGMASSPAQSVQAVDNAATMAQARGANAPVLQMLQRVLGVFQQALSLIQGLKKMTNGAQIKKG